MNVGSSPHVAGSSHISESGDRDTPEQSGWTSWVLKFTFQRELCDGNFQAKRNTESSIGNVPHCYSH